MRLRDRETKQRPLTPEHDARDNNHDSGNDLTPDVTAAYSYVDSVINTSDYVDPVAWHGWALREAFLAGISHAKRGG